MAESADPRLIVEAWLNSPPPPKAAQGTSDPIESFELSIQRLTRMTEALDRLREALLQRGAPAEGAWPFLERLLQDRQKYLAELGELVFQWRLAGNSVRFQSEVGVPRSSNEAVPGSSPLMGGYTPPSSLGQDGVPPSRPAGSHVYTSVVAGIPVERRASRPYEPDSRYRPSSTGELNHWYDRFREPRYETRAEPRVYNTTMEGMTQHRKTLRALMKQLGPPVDHAHHVDLIDETDALLEATQRERVEPWKQLPPEMQRAWLTLLVARARAMAEKIQTLPGARGKLQAVFPRLSAYSKEEQPGYVHGLAVGHMPTRGTWYADAEHAWNELSKLIEELTLATGATDDDTEEEEPPSSKEAPPTPVSPSAAMSAAVNRSVAAGMTPEVKVASGWTPIETPGEITGLDPLEDSRPIEATWAGWKWARDRRAVIFSTELREETRLRIKEVFAFAELAWVGISQVKRTESLLTRLQSKNIDLLLLAQPVVDQEPAMRLVEVCREADVAWAIVEGPLGPGAIRRALEKSLHPSRQS